jgi:hypothetical protein
MPKFKQVYIKVGLIFLGKAEGIEMHLHIGPIHQEHSLEKLFL